ncbi:DUF4349 domain-containing protein [Flagellimonas myxillae]|uniref:DUF4349 domain-containing protein n=1 Tax=Flagellimonas myxillae TaxID=2942214 RepID=UPI00201F502D|nr:DUF4349 domain-containing protein [Muricauda myxillae]MCL6267334.1 DUF4349 domain-containing protein [Muricauda myxillae]
MTKYHKLRKSILRLSLGLVLLFLFRLIYGYNEPTYNDSFIYTEMSMEIPLEIAVRKNYATTKYPATNQTAIHVDQKYEKIADIDATTHQFDQDEKQLREQIESLKGLIQFENKTGNDGYRHLHLVIGVPPKNFDQLYHNLIAIGNITSKEITKKDKTNEYNELKAKRASLTETKRSLEDLKLKSGEINEYILLENRILEIEQQLQELGVSLGSFDSENEFCTVKFELSERQPLQIEHLQIIKNAMEWSISTYLKIMLILTVIALFSYLLALIIEKIKNNI